MRIAVIGTGYVGLVTGVCLSERGHEVVCVDVDRDRIDLLQRGTSPIFEPGLDSLLRRGLGQGRLRFTTDVASGVADAAVCFIAVGTPSREDGAADSRHVMTAAADIARTATGPLVLAIKSTVPVGTCQSVQDCADGILRERRVGFEIDAVSNPEFLKEGSAVEDFNRPARIIVGAGSESADRMMRRLYSDFIRSGHAYIAMSIRSAEMTKYAANCMLAARISLINELSQICGRLGADIMEVRRGVGSDPRIGMDFLDPGIGYGGACLPKDVKALSHAAQVSDCPADMLAAVERVNQRLPLVFVDRIISHFGGSVAGRRFAVWGLAFKPETDDVRGAPSLAIIHALTQAGARVCAFDPVALENARASLRDPLGKGSVTSVTFASNMYAAAEGADALLLLTQWEEFRKPDFERLRALLVQPLIFDGRNQYEPEAMGALGFTYHCIGRPTLGPLPARAAAPAIA